MKKVIVVIIAIVVGCFFIGCGDYQPCQSDKDCPPPKTCSSLNGTCVSASSSNNTNNNTNNNNQPPKSSKDRGRGQTCDKQNTCKEGLVCLAGTCGNCQSDAQCRNANGGRSMACVNGYCRRRCNDVDECKAPDQEVCLKANDSDKTGICQRPQCRSNVTCKEGYVCKGLRCVPETCKRDLDCPYGHICNAESNKCERGCRRDQNCHDEQYCNRGNKCVDKCKRDLDCEEDGFVCKAGRCQKPNMPKCKSDVDCQNAGLAGYICELKDGQKQCVPGCRSASDLCGGAHLCKKLDPNCQGPKCKGTCVPAPCSVDVDCGKDEICHQRSICIKKPEPKPEMPPTDGGTPPEPPVQDDPAECGSHEYCVRETNGRKLACEQRLTSGQNNRCVPCLDHVQCQQANKGHFCLRHTSGDNNLNKCVECIQSPDCVGNPNGSVCKANKCVPVCTKATESTACKAPTPKCKERTSTSPAKCVECVKNADCSNGRVCNSSNKCVPVCTKATESTACKAPTPKCKEETSSSSAKCVECVKNADCSNGRVCNSNNKCVPVCTKATESTVCKAPTPKCKEETSSSSAKCVECVKNADCSNGRVCNSSNKCVPVCTKATESTACKAPTPKCKEETSSSSAKCVECVKNADCSNGRVCNSNNKCIPKCTTANQATTCPGRLCKEETSSTPAQCVVCLDGMKRSCYTGQAKHRDVGACKSGIQTCTGNTWPSTCAGEVKPTAETCDDVDNDCDGIKDNNLDKAVYGKTCFDHPDKTKIGVGPCKAGVTTCVAGQTKCVGQVLPTKEVCEAYQHLPQVDNDCDGQVNETSELNIEVSGHNRGVLRFYHWAKKGNRDIVTFTNTGAKVLAGYEYMVMKTSAKNVVKVNSCVLYSQYTKDTNDTQICRDRTKLTASQARTQGVQGIYPTDFTKARFYLDIGGGSIDARVAAGMPKCSAGLTGDKKLACCPTYTPKAGDWVVVIGSVNLLKMRNKTPMPLK